MFKITIDLWVLVAAITVPSLFILSISIFIFRKGFKSTDGSDVPPNSKDKKKFKDEVAFQVAFQELDMLLVNTVSNLEKQRSFLQGYLSRNTHADLTCVKTLKDNNDEIKPVIKESNGNPDSEIDSHDSRNKRLKNPDHFESNANYATIPDLHKSGMTAKQISAKIKIPQSEVDLYFKLHLKKDQISIIQ